MTKEDEDSKTDSDYDPVTTAPKVKKKKIKQCYFCEKSFDVNSAKLDVRFRGRFRCEDCVLAGIEHKPRKQKDKKCRYCGNRFMDSYKVENGVKIMHKKCPDCRQLKIPKGPLPKPKAEYLECDLCGQR